MLFFLRGWFKSYLRSSSQSVHQGSYSTPLASTVGGWFPRMAVYPRVWLPHYSRGTLLVHRRDSVGTEPWRRCIYSLSRCVFTGHACEATPQKTLQWERGKRNRVGPNSLCLGFAHRPAIFQSPSALLLPGRRLPLAFMPSGGEESIHGGTGKRWDSVVLDHRWEVGQESDQLPSMGQGAVRGRKEEAVLFNHHTYSSIFWGI